MKILVILLALFLGVGLFARKFNAPVRLLLIVGILSLVFYSTFL